MSEPREADDPPDPRLVTSRNELAAALTTLRTSAGLSVRDVAALSGVPHGTVSGWMSGQHAPVAAYRARFEAVLTACGVTGEDDQALWWEAADRARQTRSARGALGRAPYQGLHAFQVDDSAWFFGRDGLVDRALSELVSLGESAPTAPPAVMAVIGASGSGKSSLIRAGIIPALDRRDPDGEPVLEGWRAVLMTPGAHPNETLAGLTVQAKTLLCVDQFEELWTQVESEPERTAFLQSLLRLAQPPEPCIVLIGLRADFYGAASRRHELQPALQDRQLLVGPMTSSELETAIIEPARRAGAQVDHDLVKVLLGDLASRSVAAAHDPGALPLLSHALLATWERSNRRRLTVSDYYTTGGIAGAIEQAAESTYEGLGSVERACVPGLFLRLVTLDGETISRRQLPVGEVIDGSPSDEAMAAVVDAFCDARLLTRQIDTVEISHEALISAWPRLQGWVMANRAGLVVHRRLAVAARQWAAGGRADDLLLPPGRVDSLREWASLDGESAHLNRLEHEFLSASEAHRDRAVQLAERQQRSRRRRGIAAVVLAVLCAGLFVVATGAYLHARHLQADDELSRDEARSRQVALTAAKLRTEDPALSSQLALAAYRISPTVEARSALLDATAIWTPRRILGRPGPMQVRASPDGRRLATADAAGQVRLFSLDPAAPSPVASFAATTVDPPDLYALAWSDDGSLLAAGGQGAPTVWDVSDPAAPHLIRTLPVNATTYGLTFVPHSHTLLAGTSDGRVVGWQDPRQSPTTDVVDDIGEAASALAVSPDGNRLAVVGAADRLELWRLDGVHATDRLVGALPDGRGLSVAFGPAGRELGVGTAGGEVRRWAVTKHRLRPRPSLTGFTSFVNALAYRSDHQLVAGSSDQTAAVYDLTDGRRLATMPGPAIVVSIAVAGDQVVTASTDGTTRLWPLPDPTLHDARGPGWQLGVSADQHQIAEATGRGDGTIRLYRIDRAGHPEQRQVLRPDTGGAIAGTAALSADGTLLAGGTTGGQIELWRLADGHAARLGEVNNGGPDPPRQPASQLQVIALSPDNRRMASIDATDEFTTLWDTTKPQSPVREPVTLPAGAIPLAAAFSPDSTLLAVGDANDEVTLWNVADPAAPTSYGVLGTFDDDVTSVAFTPRSAVLAVGSADRTIRLWDLSTPTKPRELSRLGGPEAAVYSVSFSSDGTRLAAGSGDGSLWLYDLSDPTHPVTTAALGASGERVHDARFVDDDTRVVGTGPSGALRFWRVQDQAAIDEICNQQTDLLTAHEWSRYLTGIPVRPICP